MNRKDILEDCPEGYEDQLKEILDHFEGKFNEIKLYLDIGCIADLENIANAYRLAVEIGDELY